MPVNLTRRDPLFEASGFPGNVTMQLRRMESWDWAAARNASIASAAALREGGAVLERYGFDPQEFEVLSDPESWEGVAEFVFAVELAERAIDSWHGVLIGGAPAPVNRVNVTTLMRDERIRRAFLKNMEGEGSALLEDEAEKKD